VKADEVDYKIIGDDLQLVEVELDPGEKVIAEAGAMCYMEEDITFEARMGDGSEQDEGLLGKLFNAGKRALAGQSVFITHFINSGRQKRIVSFAAPYPGKIIPVDLSEYGNSIYCQKEAFLCAAFGTKIDITFTKRLGAGFFGGEGFILENLTGDGLAFLHAGGTIVKKELKGETIRVDTGCIVAFTEGIDYDIVRAGNLKTMFLGGEGLFLATLRGTGTVYLQSLPFSRLADRIIASIPKSAVSGPSNSGSLLSSLSTFTRDDG